MPEQFQKFYCHTIKIFSNLFTIFRDPDFEEFVFLKFMHEFLFQLYRKCHCHSNTRRQTNIKDKALY